MEVEAPLEQPRIKLVLIGNSGVGKSALLLRLTKESFHLEPSTIGVDFIASTMDLNGVRVKLLIWDTSGQERFAKMASAYYRRTQGVILVYDVSNRASFAALPKWLAEVEQQTSADIVKIIIGNKVDKEASREVSEAEGARFARQHGTLFVEASAKTSEGSSTAPPLNIRLLLLGNSGVGKSALMLRFTDETFLPENESLATTGVDFKVSKMEVNGQRVKLSIWDTAGQERFRSITSSYYRGAQGIILVYDVSNRKSFDALSGWLSEVQEHANDAIVKILIGNKVDKEVLRVVSEAEGASFAKEKGTLFMEASAKTSVGVREAFRDVVTTMETREKSKAPPLKIKLLLIGNSSVGKSSLLLRFAEETFLEGGVSPTLGVDIRWSRMEVNDVRVELSIWDTAGSERHRTMTSAYYRGAQGVILVYDVFNRASFEALPGWLDEVRKQTNPDIITIFVGNKVDKEGSRAVSEEEGATFAEKMGTRFVEASAKTSEGVREAFREIVAKHMSSPGSSTTPPLIIKLLLIGSSRVGKSAILLRFTDGMFLPETNSPNTLGVDFRASRMEVNGTNVKLSIWDTAGQERYRTITSSYYRNAQGIILALLYGESESSVYDVTDKQSFEDLPGWLSEVNEHTKDEVVKILIGAFRVRIIQIQLAVTEGITLFCVFMDRQ
ncbi:Insulin-like growth factor 2 mRNA-binding protein 3 [Tulasnella sp. 330]|nr:Insulin-like growth factor 2 mRNA-binding protein 3 [Tulasnella sp. 330]